MAFISAEALFQERKLMSDEPVFVDTNILVYAHDRDAGDKHLEAKAAVESLWNRAILPSVSIQVLQEFYVNLIRKRVKTSKAREAVMNYLEWDVIENDRNLLLDGMQLQEKWALSFWDALIVAAAHKARAHELWSEDLNPGQDYDGVFTVNPLAKE
jgi:predicted nucleic acid-binding protein